MCSMTSDLVAADAAALRTEGWRGGAITAHRGLRIMPRHRWRLRASLMMGPLITAVVVAIIPRVILPFWGVIGRLWCAQLTPRAHLLHLAYGLPFGYQLLIPVPNLAAGSPTIRAWILSAIIVAIMILAGLLLRRRHFPLSLALITFSFIFVIGLAGFTPLLAPFPYVLSGYVQSMLLMGLVLMAVTPLVFMVIYYPLNFTFTKKISLTLMALMWLACALPCQFFLQAVLVHHMGLIALPPLFLLSGLLLDVIGLVALYSWGMSWRLRHE